MLVSVAGGLAVFAALGALAGVVWEWVWTPAIGIVYDHAWIALNAIELQQQFSATGWYVVVAVVAGLVGGLLVTLLIGRKPLLTLAAVVVGSVLAAWLMGVVGAALGPADPDSLAKTATDGTRLPMALSVTGLSPWASFPVGALVGVVVVFLGLSPHRGRRVERPAETPEPVDGALPDPETAR